MREKKYPAIASVALILSLALSYGCLSSGPAYDNVMLDLSYKQIMNDTVEYGTLKDSISFDRSAVYFEVRARMINLEQKPYTLRIMSQQLDQGFFATLPLYSREYVNGQPRDWENITKVSGGDQDFVYLMPGDIHDLEQPIFFYNQAVSQSIPNELDLAVEIADASGNVVTKKTIHISSN